MKKETENETNLRAISSNRSIHRTYHKSVVWRTVLIHIDVKQTSTMFETRRERKITNVVVEDNSRENSNVDDTLLALINVELFLVQVFQFYPNRSSMILHWSVAEPHSFPTIKTNQRSKNVKKISSYQDNLIEKIR